MLRATLIVLIAALPALPARAQTIPRTAGGDASASVPHWPFGVARGPLSTTIFRGQELAYEVVDGLAVLGGDIVLGTAEEAAATRDPLAFPGSMAGLSRSTSTEPEDHLWPGGVIPYVIDEHVEDSKAVLEAISIWNRRTVISLVERDAEPNYVRFRKGDGACRSHIGMIGGEQSVWGTECGVSILVHEIGHTVGLWHEHQRMDRDRYLMVHSDNIAACTFAHNMSLAARHARPYDFASAMHYGRGLNDLPWFETIPPGMSIGSGWLPAPLSSGDIDYVAHLYGPPPSRTTISTNPPGLRIVVDGVETDTPVSFEWEPGSRHSIEALSPQFSGDRTRYLFGRWTDEGSQAHVVTADPATTWYQASFIEQEKLLPSDFHQSQEGTIRIAPRADDDFYTVGSLVEFEAIPSPGRSFDSWDLDLEAARSPAENPLILAVPSRRNGGDTGRLDVSFMRAKFLRGPVVRIDIDGSPMGHGYLLTNSTGGRRTSNDGGRTWFRRVPRAWAVDDFFREYRGEDGKVRVTTYDAIDPFDLNVIRRFLAWSDGVTGTLEASPEGGYYALVTRELEVPAEGGTFTMQLEDYLPIRRWSAGGEIDITPPPTELYGEEYPWNRWGWREGTLVQVTARPLSEERRFVAWRRDAYGTDPVTALHVYDATELEAVFSVYPLLEPGSPTPVEWQGATFDSRHIAGYWVHVPVGAQKLTVELSLEGGEYDATLGVGLTETEYLDELSFSEQVRDGGARLVITRESQPPLVEGPWFLSVIGSERVEGRIQSSVVQGPPVITFPRAFTFVSVGGLQPPTQTFELRNLADQPLSYRIASDRDWLTVHPAEVTLEAGREAELAVQASASGEPGTYRADVTITSDRWPDQGVDLPVTLAVAAATSAGTCVSDDETMCLQDSRFEVRVDWWTGAGRSGPGSVDPAGTNDSGLFRFFDRDNWEILIKVLDGCALNGHVWVYGASTTDLGYSIRVRDTVSGESAEYRNEAGRPAPAITDNEAFSAACGEGRGAASASRHVATDRSTGLLRKPLSLVAARSATSGCAGSDSSLCLADSRFEVTVDWSTADGGRGPARAVPVGTNNSGLFYFFEPGNWEMLIKVLDGCAINDHHWVYAASATDQGLDIVVTDTLTGKTWTHSKAPGPPAPAITESNAFHCSP